MYARSLCICYLIIIFQLVQLASYYYISFYYFRQPVASIFLAFLHCKFCQYVNLSTGELKDLLLLLLVLHFAVYLHILVQARMQGSALGARAHPTWKNVPLRNVKKRRESSAQICRPTCKRMCTFPLRYDKIKTKKVGKKKI